MLLVYFIFVGALLPINSVDSMLRLRAPVATRRCISFMAKALSCEKIWSPLHLPQRYVGLALYSSGVGMSDDSITRKKKDTVPASPGVVVKPMKATKKAVTPKLLKISEITEDAAR